MPMSIRTAFIAVATAALMMPALTVPAAAEITTGGTHNVTGNSGTTIVNAPGQTVVLRLTNANSSGILVHAANEVVLQVEGTNTVTLPSGANGAIDSNAPVVMSGGGQLSLNSPAHGITASAFRIHGGALNINAGVNGINTSGNTLIGGGHTVITAVNDGIHANRNLTMTAGHLEVSQSLEGLESLVIDLQGGTTTIHATDDAINTTVDDVNAGENPMPSMSISGGGHTLFAGGDGIDSNGPLTISGGITHIYGSTTNGDSSLDSDGPFTLSGGTVVGTGNFGIPRLPDGGGKGWIYAPLNIASGTLISIQNTAGQELYSLPAHISAGTIFASVPEMNNGEVYTVTAGGATVQTIAGQAVNIQVPTLPGLPALPVNSSLPNFPPLPDALTELDLTAFGS